MASSQTEALRVESLSKTFGRPRRRGRADDIVQALRDVSLTVQAGDCVGIAGESGSGKSTLARIIVGLETSTDGAVYVHGERLPEPPKTTDRHRHARRVQMVFQDPYSSLDPRQPIGAALDEVQRVHFSRSPDQRRTRTFELLDAVGIASSYFDALPRALSGGQRQRVAIARALAAEPSVIVLDEAVSALDVSTQAQILNLLADLRSEFSLTYVFISHDLAVIRQVADTIVVLYRGRIMEQGRIDDIFRAPANPYTQLLLDSVPRRGMSLTNRPDRGSHSVSGCLFRGRCPVQVDKCAQEPPLIHVSPSRQSRCWHAQAETITDTAMEEK